MESQSKIKNISDYLKVVVDKVEELKKCTGYTIFCYRGEDCIHDPKTEEPYQAGMPNIFRPNQVGNLNHSLWYENNILDEMKSNKLSGSDQYLEIAMDAQHGGFPSRLLDVSFNSLVALFFAVTPFYNEKETAHDKIDGRVLIYASDKLTTSNTVAIRNIYKQIIDEKKYSTILDAHFHMLIDFVDLNSRIKAQQGGFILFGGNQFIPIPEWKYREIIIPSESKKNLREELKSLFGIEMGTIYPEPNNRVNHITNRAKTIENRVNYYEVVTKEIELDLISKKNKIIRLADNLSSKELTNAIMDMDYYFHRLSIYMQSLKDDIGVRDNICEKDKLSIIKILEKYLLEINTLMFKRFEGNVINPDLFK